MSASLATPVSPVSPVSPGSPGSPVTTFDRVTGTTTEFRVPAPQVTIRSRRSIWIFAIAVVVMVAALLWAGRHFQVLDQIYGNGSQDRHLQFETIWAISFLILLVQLVLAWTEPIHRVAVDDQVALAAVADLTITLNVPVYNEDPACLERGLYSIIDQTRRPDRVQVVDDGSDVDYGDLRERFIAAANEAGIDASWVRQVNAGKRHAQAVTFGADDADIYITVDSDTLLDEHAIEEGLKPFADERITSVAGLYLGLNATHNWLTRVAELVCVSWQLQGRSASSRMGSVLVNSGAFALYRGWVFRKYLDAYLNESFFGHPVPFSDDAHMTMFCLLHGRTVQQPTAASLTLYPEAMSNYCRQYTRWMRGAFVRMWWRFRYLPLTSFALWNEVIGLMQFVLGCVIFVGVYLYWPTVDHRVLPYTIAIPLVLGYVVNARYLLVKRSDVSTGQTLITFAMAPVMILWCWLICRPIKIYAMLTCLRTGWGTRGDGVEVALRN